MKKIILLITLLSVVVNTFSQETTTPTKNKEYYLEKSKSKKQTAWILLGAGTAAAVGGAIGFGKNFEIFSSSSSAADTYAVIFLAGVVADLVSIPFFISAGHYKRLAAEVAISHQNIYLQKQNSMAVSPIPALTIKINF
jgi:hypothetical protein